MQIEDDDSTTMEHQLSIDILDVLISPLRTDYIFERWTPKEIAIFEGAFCRYGPELSFIQHLIRTKTINEVNAFYDLWKKTSHYKAWKNHQSVGHKNSFNSWL